MAKGRGSVCCSCISVIMQSSLCGSITIVDGVDGFHEVLVHREKDGEHLHVDKI